jgi:hypothetical protein
MTGNSMGHCKKTDVRHIMLTMVIPLVLALSLASVVVITTSSAEGSDVVIQGDNVQATEVLSEGDVTTGGIEEGSMMLAALGILSSLAILGLAIATRSGWHKDS